MNKKELEDFLPESHRTIVFLSKIREEALVGLRVFHRYDVLKLKKYPEQYEIDYVPRGKYIFTIYSVGEHPNCGCSILYLGGSDGRVPNAASRYIEVCSDTHGFGVFELVEGGI